MRETGDYKVGVTYAEVTWVGAILRRYVILDNDLGLPYI